MVVIWTFPGNVRVVEVERRAASPKPGLAQKWLEFQVRQGRRILSRHDRRTDARNAAEALASESAA